MLGVTANNDNESGRAIRSIFAKGESNPTPLFPDVSFPKDKEQIKTFVEHSTEPERNKILQLVKRMTDRQYQNVSDLADSIKECVRKEWDNMLMNK